MSSLSDECLPHSNQEVEDLSTTSLSSPDERSEVLSLEKGFWRVRHGAQELLRFSDIYRRSRIQAGASHAEAIPYGIDLVAMTQLSWGVLHAVGDIKTHQRRTVELEALWRKDRSITTRHPASLYKEPATSIGCSRCSRLDSPRWRRGPDGSRTLCNVCGLVYAKKSRRLKADKKLQRTGSLCMQPLQALA